MKISYKPGDHGDNPEKDRQIYIKTENHCEEGEEATMFRLGLLVNQFAINELTIWNYNWEKTDEICVKDGTEFFFKEFITQAIKDAENSVDWGEPKNEEHIIRLCEKYYLSKENIDFGLLRRTQQKKLQEYNKYEA